MTYDIVTYCSANYFDRLAFAMPCLERTSARWIHVYTDAPDRDGRKGRVWWHSTFARPVPEDQRNWCYQSGRKTEAILEHMRTIGGAIYHCDLDCLVLRDPAHVFERHEFDVAVTMRPDDDHELEEVLPTLNPHPYRCPSGSLWLRDTPEARVFVDSWADQQRLLMEMRSSCHYTATGQGISFHMWGMCLAMSQRLGRAVLLGLNTHAYNSHPTDPSQVEIRKWFHRLRELRKLGRPATVLHFPQAQFKDTSLVVAACSEATGDPLWYSRHGGSHEHRGDRRGRDDRTAVGTGAP